MANIYEISMASLQETLVKAPGAYQWRVGVDAWYDILQFVFSLRVELGAPGSTVSGIRFCDIPLVVDWTVPSSDIQLEACPT